MPTTLTIRLFLNMDARVAHECAYSAVLTLRAKGRKIAPLPPYLDPVEPLTMPFETIPLVHPVRNSSLIASTTSGVWREGLMEDLARWE